MKKYIIAVLLLFIPCVTYALTMCARDNSLVVVLNSGPNTSSGGNNISDWMWRANFNYGTLVGEATCLSELEGGLMATPGSTTNIGGKLVDNSIPKGLRGIYNDDSVYGNRKYCWCRMTHPAISRWVSRGDMTSHDKCAANCVYYCTDLSGAMNSSVIRSAMFNSIGK